MEMPLFRVFPQFRFFLVQHKRKKKSFIPNVLNYLCVVLGVSSFRRHLMLAGPGPLASRVWRYSSQGHGSRGGCLSQWKVCLPSKKKIVLVPLTAVVIVFVQEPDPDVPSVRQLYHHRLVQRVAAGCPPRGRRQVPRVYGDGQRGGGIYSTHKLKTGQSICQLIKLWNLKCSETFQDVTLYPLDLYSDSLVVFLRMSPISIANITLLLFSQNNIVPLVREKSGTFKVREKSGNFVIGQGNLEFWEKSGNFGIGQGNLTFSCLTRNNAAMPGIKNKCWCQNYSTNTWPVKSEA